MRRKNIRGKTCFLIFLLFVCTSRLMASGGILQTRISLDLDNVTLPYAFDQIKAKSGLGILYKPEEVASSKRVSVHVSDATVQEVLSSVLADTDLGYVIQNDVIVVKKNESKGSQQPNSAQQSSQTYLIKGKVVDEEAESLIGVSVILKSNRAIGVTTDIEGNFTIPVSNLSEVLVFSYIGMETQEVKLNAQSPQKPVRVTLKVSENTLKQVVVIGTIQRDKESFTGAATTVTGRELKAVSNQNVIQSLKTLDPSFVVLENQLSGANPNVMPTIEIRGQTSLTVNNLQDQFSQDPNQPLFILDGFETTLKVINDLDMNRVASITILKDAASTAIYGVKAANGVVVVETKKPQPGRLRVTYTADLRVENPDLSSYNMMNAEEKLEFEVLSQRYMIKGGTSAAGYIRDKVEAKQQMALDEAYSKRKSEISRGVDTYWMNEPVQTGFSNRQSLIIQGGSEQLLLNAGLSYNSITGVMKNSGRSTWSGNVDVTYRSGKLNVTNRLTVGGYNSEESNYGSFSTWANTNPYYRKDFGGGTMPKYLEDYLPVAGVTPIKVVNPLYNASLNRKNEGENLNVNNNFQIIWSFSPQYRLQGSLSLIKESTTNIVFTPPEDTQFDGAGIFKKGTYDNSASDYFSCQASLMFTVAKVFGKNRLNFNARSEIQQTDNSNLRISAVGYPYNTNGNPAFAYSYIEGQGPGYATKKFRRVNAIASGNYSYDERYLFDATYRLDGSTAFGSSEKYSPFWALGTGWNIHKESFMENNHLFSTLRMRGNVGVTGNQDLASVASVSIYQFTKGYNVFGTGYLLTTLGNEHLKWQNTRQVSVGMDVDMLKGRFGAVLDVYDKKTDPQVIAVNQALSTGAKQYPMNMGYIDSKGAEFTVKYSPIFLVDRGIVWNVRVMGSLIRSEYGGFGEIAETLNKQQLQSNSMIRFRNGFSPQDLWAVRSMGIDPATGKEIFLTKEGKPTFVYNSNDIVKVGNSRPDLLGVIGTSLTYRDFSLSCNLRYSIGGDIFNSDLYNKVENISFAGLTSNQDRRALYDRWQKPGDVAQFKSISITSTTPMSSRFVQEENYLSGESASVSWMFRRESWIKTLGMESLRVSAFMNDFFRLSTVKAERGIYYPFSRTVSFSLNASF